MRPFMRILHPRKTIMKHEQDRLTPVLISSG
jgi:hypothetical protein